MRRISALVLAIMSMLVVGVGPALAAPPVHVPLDLPPLEFAAGDMCTFPILLDLTDDRIREMTFAPTGDGTVRVVQRGSGLNIATNLWTGETLSFAGGSIVTILFRADGSIDAWGAGSLFAFSFEGDASDLVRGMHSIRGRAVEHYAPDGSLVNATFSGRSTNMCEVLAGD
jgi:hypothetical protein